MEELIEKIENLKEALDKTNEVKMVTYYLDRVLKDKELVKDIEKYNVTRDVKLLEKISNNTLFNDYKRSETDLNLLIMKINSRLKDISKKDGCFK